ncbi:hypothetical protein [Calothrix sp. UHCC 0171]|uniref:hypothetical protein n=1 Tax=Calothrix sp. UHCC 0171 TaxID=3110245 RepID=UPI002B2165DA|nr:hypothetical protein [Calothrix sp. UHCC 0171]MEA5574218.1 hypothetical protein [Calothrix sp. UHCC 0171]
MCKLNVEQLIKRSHIRFNGQALAEVEDKICTEISRKISMFSTKIRRSQTQKQRFL